MFFRQKPSGSYQYVQIVENHREGGRVRQRTLMTAGYLAIERPDGCADSFRHALLR